MQSNLIIEMPQPCSSFFPTWKHLENQNLDSKKIIFWKLLLIIKVFHRVDAVISKCMDEYPFKQFLGNLTLTIPHFSVSSLF